MIVMPLPCIILHLRQAKGWPDSTAPMRFYLLPGKNPTDVFGWGYEEGHQRGCSMHLLLRYAASLGKPVQESAPWLAVAASKVPATKSAPLLDGETEDTRALRGHGHCAEAQKGYHRMVLRHCGLADQDT